MKGLFDFSWRALDLSCSEFRISKFHPRILSPVSRTLNRRRYAH